MRNEAEFQGELKQSFDCYCDILQVPKKYYKPPDLGLQNPFDCFMMWEGKVCCVEAKFCKPEYKMNGKGIAFKSLFNYEKQYHQIITLRKMERCGFKSYCILNVFFGQNKNYVYAIDPVTIYKFYIKGTIPLSEVIANSIEIKKTARDCFGKLHWDLSPILN